MALTTALFELLVYSEYYRSPQEKRIGVLQLLLENLKNITPPEELLYTHATDVILPSV